MPQQQLALVLKMKNVVNGLIYLNLSRNGQMLGLLQSIGLTVHRTTQQ